MNNKYFIPQNFIDVHKFSKQAPITGVFLIVNEDTGYMAGTEGNVLQVECPSGTQDMANDLLTKAQGYQYQGYESPSTKIPLDAELGDGVNVGGFYGLLADQTLEFGGGDLSDISAPGDDEVDHAYPYVSRERREINRKIAQTRAQFIVGLDTIRGEVAGKLNSSEAQTLIAQNLESITLSATAGENKSTISIKANGITIDSQVVTFSNIVADEISATDIIGSLKSDQIDLYGDMTVWKDSRLRTAGGSLGYTSSTLDGSGGIHLLNDDGDCEVRVTTNGAAVESNASSFIAASNATISSSGAVRLLGDSGCYSNGETITSDQRLKNSVDYKEVENAASIVDELKPCSFKYNYWQKDKKHFGFIAQDVIEVFKNHGYGETDVIVGQDPETEMYALAYTEFIPLLVSKIQQMDLKIKELEEKLNG